MMMASPHMDTGMMFCTYDDAENEICKRYVQCMQSSLSRPRHTNCILSILQIHVTSSQGYDDHFPCFDTMHMYGTHSAIFECGIDMLWDQIFCTVENSTPHSFFLCVVLKKRD